MSNKCALLYYNDGDSIYMTLAAVVSCIDGEFRYKRISDTHSDSVYSEAMTKTLVDWERAFMDGKASKNFGWDDINRFSAAPFFLSDPTPLEISGEYKGRVDELMQTLKLSYKKQ